MFTEDQLKALRDELPYDSAKRIKSKLRRTSKNVIAKALADPNTNRIDILEAAVEVCKEHKAKVAMLVGDIQELAS